MNNILREVNETQTQLSQEEFDGLSKYVRNELLEIVNKVDLVKQLIKPDRKKAKDLERDESGRIKVNIEEPHILEDMDYFRPLALHYEKHGTYTNLFPNPAPNSEYRKFWDEQIRRCKYGYVRESDGEWITGYHYFYLNFSPIMKTIIPEGAERNEDGTIKTERIYTFPDFWDGDYWFFHHIEQAEQAGKHINALKSRGKGYSFKGSSMPNRNYYMFPKAKTYTLASDKEYLIKDGLLTKTWDNMDWMDSTTPFARAREVKDQDMHRRASYKDPQTNAERGSKSEIIGMSCKDNPQKPRGKRGKLMLFEEEGKFPQMDISWNIVRDSMEEGRRVFGTLIAFGTGGEEGADFEAAKKLTYRPRAYNVMPVKNIYDKVSGQGECSFFVPVYTNRADCYDKNGNSDVIKALVEILEDRQVLFSGGSDNVTIQRRKAENPITIQEAILKTGDSDFPVADINDYLAEIESNYDRFISPHYVGRMAIEDGEVVFRQDATLSPIRDFPISDDINKEGAIEVFDLPKEGTHSMGIGDRYIMGVDAVKNDKSEYSDSLASAFVFDTWLDKIVAEFTCRPYMVDDFNEQVFRMAKYYNAEINFENTMTAFYSYFRNKNAWVYLCDTPSILRSMELTKGEGRGNTAKGSPVNQNINAQARLWQSDWMKKTPTGEEESSGYMNLHRIRSIAYLKEAADWNPDGNFDRVSAMGMVMILRQDKLNTLDTRMSQKVETIADDPFFEENYDDLYNATNPNSFDFDQDGASKDKQQMIDMLLQHEN